jgi:hypothetical protein
MTTSPDDGDHQLKTIVNQPRSDPWTSWKHVMGHIEICLNTILSCEHGFVVLYVDRPDDPFVRIAAAGLARIEAEASATVVVDPATKERQRVDPATERALRRLGWNPPNADPLAVPEPGQHAHFHWSWTHDTGYPQPLFCELAVRTMVEAFKVEDPSLAKVWEEYSF